MGLLSGYVTVAGNILEARHHGGNIIIEIAVVESRANKIFTGEAELEKLKNKHIKLNIPKIKTKEKEK